MPRGSGDETAESALTCHFANLCPANIVPAQSAPNASQFLADASGGIVPTKVEYACDGSVKANFAVYDRWVKKRLKLHGSGLMGRLGFAAKLPQGKS